MLIVNWYLQLVNHNNLQQCIALLACRFHCQWTPAPRVHYILTVARVASYSCVAKRQATSLWLPFGIESYGFSHLSLYWRLLCHTTYHIVCRLLTEQQLSTTCSLALSHVPFQLWFVVCSRKAEILLGVYFTSTPIQHHGPLVELTQQQITRLLEMYGSIAFDGIESKITILDT
jgi:hypothetical protein